MPGPVAAPADKEDNFKPLPPTKPFQSTLRYPSSRKSIYDRNLNRTRVNESSLASFAYLFNTLITYHHSKSGSVSEIETRLNRAGYPIGTKLLDLLLYRQPPRTATRPTRILELLQFVHGTVWRALFNRTADALEQGTEKKNEYMIIDNEPLVNSFISIPKEISQLNCAAFVAGIIEGMCDATGLSTDGVTAHWAGEGDELWPGKTIFLLRFKESVVERDEALKAG
ncbi:NO signaling/Golgi transport ligand-binding domain-containing protein [Neohortaea acidophila]|uniref:Trafficking protein particle complex subunit n=1 Tax=Neohortaea acidophila TaxID=245834 RepID=A0A6A6Q1D5_9PEZI|nr:NO signaling/Golgi transport ligand-binding domain-containing protein [Neohortaea acidophila]KAF2486220.1 NO signaling/Golgi transport ligand-binding domain-containing protein [Neohortaea acidophila]